MDDAQLVNVHDNAIRKRESGHAPPQEFVVAPELEAADTNLMETPSISFARMDERGGSLYLII